MTARSVLRVRESTLEFVDQAGKLCWSLPIAALVLISEYTTNEGPWCDDYFLVFVTVEEGTLYFASCTFYAEGLDDCLFLLQERLGSPVRLDLTGSTDWRSRVVWPVEMAGSDYFTFTEVPDHTWRDKLKKALLGPTLEYVISKPVRDYLQEQLKKKS